MCPTPALPGISLPGPVCPDRAAFPDLSWKVAGFPICIFSLLSCLVLYLCLSPSGHPCSGFSSWCPPVCASRLSQIPLPSGPPVPPPPSIFLGLLPPVSALHIQCLVCRLPLAGPASSHSGFPVWPCCPFGWVSALSPTFRLLTPQKAGPAPTPGTIPVSPTLLKPLPGKHMAQVPTFLAQQPLGTGSRPGPVQLPGCPPRSCPAASSESDTGLVQPLACLSLCFVSCGPCCFHEVTRSLPYVEGLAWPPIPGAPPPVLEARCLPISPAHDQHPFLPALPIHHLLSSPEPLAALRLPRPRLA